MWATSLRPQWLSWLPRQPRPGLLLMAAALYWAAVPPTLARQVHPSQPAPDARYTFAVIADTLQSPADEAPTQRMLSAIGHDPAVSFIVYDGNLKSAREACQDTLYERRQAILEAARPALIFVPGPHDWIDCGKAGAGGFDPVERLDLLRQTLFASASSMGQNPLPLRRESEISRFRPYRENVRWLVGNTVFISLNVSGANNHYLNAGGRNGEFEDRTIANGFWLAHAAEYAKRRAASAIVVLIQGNPNFERYERPEHFRWLRFTAYPRRDGYLEFKRNLLKLAQTFRGPVVLIHPDVSPMRGGFSINRPLHNDKGLIVPNLTRITFAPEDRLNQWLQIDADMARHPPFKVSMHTVPKHMPLLPVQAPPATADERHENARPPVPVPHPAPSAPRPDMPPILPEPESEPVQEPGPTWHNRHQEHNEHDWQEQETNLP